MPTIENFTAKQKNWMIDLWILDFFRKLNLLLNLLYSRLTDGMVLRATIAQFYNFSRIATKYSFAKDEVGLYWLNVFMNYFSPVQSDSS